MRIEVYYSDKCINLILHISLDFNVSKKFRIVDGIFTVEALVYNNKTLNTGSQLDDLIQLALTLEELLVESYHQLRKESSALRDVDTLFCFDEMFEHLKTKLETDKQPDYDTFRNILKFELEKYINEPDFDRFEWQKN